MPKRTRGRTTEPLRRLAQRLESLRDEAERALDAAEGETDDSEAPLRVSPSPSRRGGRGIVQRAREASTLFDTGREELFNNLESQLAKRVASLLERLDIPTRSEIEDLARRVTALERRLDAPDEAKRKKESRARRNAARPRRPRS